MEGGVRSAVARTLFVPLRLMPLIVTRLSLCLRDGFAQYLHVPVDEVLAADAALGCAFGAVVEPDAVFVD